MLKWVFSDKRTYIVLGGIVGCLVVSFLSSKLFPEETAKMVSFGLTFGIIFLCQSFARVVQTIVEEHKNDPK